MPTIEAHITAVQKDESTGWFRITTDHDKVKRLDTKIEAKAKEAAALKREGVLASLQYTSNPRHDEATGRTYQNNYYEQGIAATNGASSDDGIESITPTQRPTDPATAWRISLAAGAKLAVASIPTLEAKGYDTDFISLQQVALAWGNFLYTTPPPAARQAQQQLPATTGPVDFDPDPDPAPPRTYGDDDIPF